MKKYIINFCLLSILFLIVFNYSCSKYETLTDYFELLLTPDVLVADGNAEITVTAQFEEGLSSDIISVTFTSPIGEFKNSTENDKKSIVALISGNKATSTLTVGTESGSYTIKAMITLNDKNYEEEVSFTLNAINPENTMQLDIALPESQIVRADNFTTLDVSAQLLDADFNQNVVFTTNKSFVCPECTQSADLAFSASGAAVAKLKLNNVTENVLLSATIQEPNLTYNRTVSVLPAFPDKLVISPDRYSYTNDNSVVKIDLFYDRFLGRGEVSQDVEVIPSAVQYNSEGTAISVGRFIPPVLRTSDYQSGSPNVTLDYKLDVPGQEPDTLLPIFVAFLTEKDDGTFLKDSISLVYE